jgi:glutamine synthetase
MAGLQDKAELPEPIQSDPGTWNEEERSRHGLARLPGTPQRQEEALLGNERLRAVLGDELLGAFLAVRRSDAAWAAERSAEEVVAAHLWRY